MGSKEYFNKIMESTGLSKEEIKVMVQDKIDELEGLISTEGAIFVKFFKSR